MKILVTGGTGFIGRNLIKKLLNKNHDLVVVGRSEDKIKKVFGESVTCVGWNLSEPVTEKNNELTKA